MFQPTDRLLLIDGSGFIHRAYHAVGPKTRKSDGLPVGAVDGFVGLLWGLLHSRLSEHPVSHAGVVFDYSGRTFRNDIFEDYKANRSAPDADLRPQFALCRAAARAFGLPCIEEPGFEADDLIATWAGIADDCGAETVVVTSDKDMMQVVTARTKLFMPGHKAEIPWKWCGPDEVVEKFGVPPDRVADVLAIAGDTVDNVPGVKGIGEKGAADLIRRYDNLHAILCAPRSDKKAAMVMDAYDAADLSYRLVTLERDAPIYMTPDDLAYSAPDAEKVMAFLKAMELWSLARKIGSEAGVNPDDVEPDAEFMARSAA